MADIHSGLIQAEAFALYQSLPEAERKIVHYAGILVDDTVDDPVAYHFNQPVEVLFDSEGGLSVALWQIPGYQWYVKVGTEADMKHIARSIGQSDYGVSPTWAFFADEDETPLGEAYNLADDEALFEQAFENRQVYAENAEDVDNTLQCLGFYPSDPTQLQANESGLYALTFPDGLHYVGQSVTLKQRLATHRRTLGEFAQVRVMQLEPNKVLLDIFEQQAIDLLDRKGYPLLNVVHTSMTFRSSPIDDIIAPDVQRHWLDDPTLLGVGTPAAAPDDLRAKTARNYETYRTMPHAERVTNVLRVYTQQTIPLPATLAPLYWSVSCVPSTNKSTWPRLACFNMSGMEVCVVGHHKAEPHAHWGFVNVSDDALRMTYATDDDIVAAHAECDVRFTGYQAAGHDQVALSVASLDALDQLLRDPAVLFAARVLNLRLMGKQANVYRRFHCFDLADQLYR